MIEGEDASHLVSRGTRLVHLWVMNEIREVGWRCSGGNGRHPVPGERKKKCQTGGKKTKLGFWRKMSKDIFSDNANKK